MIGAEHRPCRPGIDGWHRGAESRSWSALFGAGESSACGFVGIAVSSSLFPAHEDELFHLNCTMRFIVTMTRLALNRIARARGVETRLATPLWAGKSSANACASVRGQQGAAAMGHIARFLAHPGRILRTALNTPPVRQAHPSHAARLFCFCSCDRVFRDCQLYRVCGKSRVGGY